MLGTGKSVEEGKLERSLAVCVWLLGLAGVGADEDYDDTERSAKGVQEQQARGWQAAPLLLIGATKRVLNARIDRTSLLDREGRSVSCRGEREREGKQT